MRKLVLPSLCLLVGTTSLAGVVNQPAVALASSAALSTVGANGDVMAITSDAEHIYLGGRFTYVGFNSGAGVAVDTSSGTRLPTLARVAGGTVRAAVSDGKGGWYIGGDFTSVAGSARSGLARILSTGALAGWAPAVTGRVDSLAVSGETIFVGGSFSSLRGSARTNAGAVDSAGNLLAWQPSPNGAVRSLAVDGTTVYLAGAFSQAGGAARSNLAAVSSTTGAATAWNPGADAPVNDLSVALGVVYAGGEFTSMGGASRAHLAAVDASAAVTAWNPGADGVVNAVAAKKDGTVVYVGGQFANAGGAPRQNLAALQTADAAATAWNPGANGAVLDLALSRTTVNAPAEATVHVAGTFSSVGGAVRHNLAGVAAAGGVTSWDPSADATVRAVATSGGGLFVGGDFGWVNGAPRAYVAALDRATLELDRDWNPGADAPVDALALAPDGSALYVGGEFLTFAGLDRKRLAAVTPSTGAVTAWAPRTNNPVNAIAATATSVFLGGTFSNINGTARSRIGSVNTTTGATSTFNPGASGTVRFLELSPDHSKLYVGGPYATIGGLSRPGCAELSTASGAVSSFAPTAGGDIVSMDLSTDGATLWCSTSSNRTYSYPLGGASTAPSWTTQTSGDVQAAEDIGTDLYIGGHFSGIKAGGQTPRLHAASLSTSTGLATAWNPTVGGAYGVWEIAVVGNLVLIGGDFDKVGTKTQPRLAVFAGP